MDTLSGLVFRPGDAGYDAERTGFNLAVEHRPQLVVGATGADDVVAAVDHAARAGVGIAVQATGHGPSVAADGDVLVSTRRMDGVRVDPATRIARIEAGARWERVLPEAAKHGLAPLNGSSPDVGAVGYTLGGGIGPLGRRYGYACDHVRRFDVVTADGRLRDVSADRDPDLFWALRGGKGNFGVVVAMEIELVPVSRLFGGGLYFAAEATAEVLHAYANWIGDLPDEMSSSVLLIRFPDDPALPEPLRDRFVTHVRIAHCGSADEGSRLIEPLRDVGPRLMDTVGDIPYTAVGAIYNDQTTPVAAYDRTSLLREPDTAAVDALVSAAGPQTESPLIVELRHLGGAYSRQPTVPSAVGGRDAAFTLFSATIVQPDGLEEARRASEVLHGAMQPWSTGATALNFLGIDDAAPERVRTAFAPDDYARLAQLKAVYDPDNLFRVNHNIPPAGQLAAELAGSSASSSWGSNSRRGTSPQSDSRR
jgi:FAD/FMN-containing dehydrogenase